MTQFLFQWYLETFPVSLLIFGAFYPNSENGFCITLVSYANKYKVSCDSKVFCSKEHGLGVVFHCSDYPGISKMNNSVL